MAQSLPFSPSPSPGISSSHDLSDSSSSDDFSTNGIVEMDLGSASRAASPASVDKAGAGEGEGEDTMSCQWEECGRVFNHLPSLIEHIHNGTLTFIHHANEIAHCLQQTILVYINQTIHASGRHVRGAELHKHLVSPLYLIFARTQAKSLSYVPDQVGRHSAPTHLVTLSIAVECDKSFTRSDALAKHMRIQHNIIPPAPGRGGNRKRKREEPEVATQTSGDGYGSFKVDPPELDEDRLSPPDMNGDHPNGANARKSATPDDEDDEDDDEIPTHLVEQMDKNTGLIFGKTPTMVKYLIMKAKHKHALDEHANLIEELRMVRYEERCWRERKDALLDEVLRVTFGYVQVEVITCYNKLKSAH